MTNKEKNEEQKKVNEGIFKNEILNNNLKIVEILSNIEKHYFDTPWGIAYILSNLLTSQIKQGMIKADDHELNDRYKILINKHEEVFMWGNLIKCNNHDINLKGLKSDIGKEHNTVFWISDLCYGYHSVRPWYTDCPDLNKFFKNKIGGCQFDFDPEDLDNFHVVFSNEYKYNLTNKN